MTNQETITCLKILLEQARAKGKNTTIVTNVSLESFDFVINNAIDLLKEINNDT